MKLIGPFLRVLGQLPVRRGEADAANVLKVAEAWLAWVEQPQRRGDSD